MPTSPTFVFVRRALRNPGTVGAAWPSSPGLAAMLARVVPTGGRPIVAELGPGTGATSGAVDARLPPEGRHIAVELDPTLADHLQREHPSVEVLRGDAGRLDTLLEAAGIEGLDAIVCGLPWSLFDEGKQRAILEQIATALAPGACFTTFAYRHTTVLGSARRFARLLDEYFDRVHVSRNVLRNFPPAFVYVCSTPK